MFLDTPKDAETLRGLLQRLIGTDLGTFANGLPAIWVEDPPSPKKGTGLHCIIYYRPRQLRPATGLTQSIQYLAWQVSLIQTTRTQEGIATLTKVGDKIRNSFATASEGASTSVADRDPILNYSLPFSKVVNPVHLV